MGSSYCDACYYYFTQQVRLLLEVNNNYHNYCIVAHAYALDIRLGVDVNANLDGGGLLCPLRI